MAFKEGDRVVVANSHYRKWLLDGQCGVIKRFWKDKIGVKLFDAWNGSSATGLFYFEAWQLLYDVKPKLEDEFIMEGMKCVALVVFENEQGTSKAYEYACFEEDIAIGDHVVCKSKHHGLGVGKVQDVKLKTESKLVREIVCKIDMSAYEKRISDRARKAELKQQMDERVKLLQNNAIYELLSKEDDVLFELLKEYKGL